MLRLVVLIALCVSVSVSWAQEADYYAADEVREVKLYFEAEDWAKQLDSLKRDRKKGRLLADVELDGVKYEKVGVRYKGNSSFFSSSKSKYQKLPFNIKLSYTDSKQGTKEGYKTLKLSNVFRDPSFVREALAYEIARAYMPASGCNFVNLYINDEYWGVYTNTQSVDDHFLDEHFGSNKGAFLKCDPEWGIKKQDGCKDPEKASLMYIGQDSTCYEGYYELKSEAGWKEFIKLLVVLKSQPQKLEKWLNVDETLWMLAFNNVLVNLDSYTGRLCHNYYLYQDKSGQFHPVLWDMNMAFGGFRFVNDGKSMSNEDMQTMSSLVHYKEKNQERPLITNLLRNSLYRKVYIAHMKTIVEEQFANGAYKERANALQDLIEPWVKEDKKRLYPIETFRVNIDSTQKASNSRIIGITELMEARTEYLTKHPLFKKESPTIMEVKHEKVDTILTITATTDDISQAWLLHRKGKSGAFKRIAMEKAGTYEEDGKVEFIWEAKLEKKKKRIQYYIIAEGAKAATLSPKRASHEFYEVD